MSTHGEPNPTTRLDDADVLVPGSVPIAVRDYPGSTHECPPVVLLHGAGGNLLAWSRVIPLLPMRALAVDLRGHGRSGDGPWSFDAVLGDLEAVVAHFGLERPVMVGHSLGGMLAALWARRHPDCPAAISFDGHRAAVTSPEHYAGMPPERVHEDLDRLRAVFDAQAASMAHPLTEQEAARLTAERAAPSDTVARLQAEVIARNLELRGDLWWLRPDAATSGALRRSPEFNDCLPVFREVTSPLLVVVATRDFEGIPAEFRDLMAAFRAGLRRDLARLATERSNITIREVDAGHDMVATQPEVVANIVCEFLTGSLPV